MSSEMAARLAEEEEKKRKRAEKFGTAKPAVNGSAEPVSASALVVLPLLDLGI